jgi:hypothetical protein
VAVGVVRAESGFAAQRRLQGAAHEPELQVGAARRIARVGQGQAFGPQLRRQRTERLADRGQALPERGRREQQDPADLVRGQAVQREHGDAARGRREAFEQDGGRGWRRCAGLRSGFRGSRLRIGSRFAPPPADRTARRHGRLLAHHARQPGRVGTSCLEPGQQRVLHEVVRIFRAPRQAPCLDAQLAIEVEIHASILAPNGANAVRCRSVGARRRRRRRSPCHAIRPASPSRGTCRWC